MEFKMRIYSELDIAEYNMKLDEERRKAVDIGSEMDFANVSLPEYTTGRFSLKPENVTSFAEGYSLEEKLYDSMAPILDCVTVNLKDEGDVTLDCTYDEFIKALEEFSKENK